METLNDLTPDFTGKSLTVDQVIVRAIDRLSYVSMKDYSNDAERRYKYMALYDMLRIVILPFLEPKITGTEEWYLFYKSLKSKLALMENQYDLEIFSKLLSDLTGLCATVMYSTGVYEPLRINADQFEAMHKAGLI